MRLLCIFVLLSNAVCAQTNLLTGDSIGCFGMSGAPAANLTTVDVAGMPFSKAMRVATGPVSPTANAWDIRPRCFATAAAKNGDTVLATFWMRAIAGPGGYGATTFTVEQNVSPYTKPASYTMAAQADWKKVEVPFNMTMDFGAGGATTGYNLSFWVTFPNQTIEIGGFSLVDYGRNVAFSSLNMTTWPYDGHAPDAPWRAAADARIEKIRKGDVSVIVHDDAGRPVPGAAVHLAMTRHAFGFGTAVAGPQMMDQGPDGVRYRQALGRYFNKVVFENALKWPQWESTGGRAQADAIFSWLKTSGIDQVRGHNVIWPGKSYLPADVNTMLSANPVNSAALRARIDKHITDVLAYTKGRATEWDIINEPVVNTDVQKVLGDAEMARWFQLARQADPNLKLYINDYNILEAGGYDLQHQNSYAAIIQRILDGGGDIQGIGLQSHFTSNLTPPTRVLDVIDRFAAFGKDLEVTEYDVTVDDPRLQADYTNDFLTVCFSHPAMKSFLIWGFWEGAHWRPSAAMIRKDWSGTPSLDVWNNLIYKKWWTDVTGTADADGTFRARGFLGDYEVEVTVDGKTAKYPLTLVGDKPNYLRVGAKEAVAIYSGGIVHAANYSSGSVAPGQAIAIFGTGFGPGDTRVLFDGIPAQVLYSVAGQAASVVPAGVSGTTNIQLEFQGDASAPVAVPVVPQNPGIYCLQGGSGQAATTEPGTPRGGYLTFYVTGEGLPPTSPIVTIGGIKSDCQFNWSGLVFPGALQVNACVPDGVSPGPAVPLLVTFNGVATQPGVTVSIR